jgi:peptidylprolyl isomerase
LDLRYKKFKIDIFKKKNLIRTYLLLFGFVSIISSFLQELNANDNMSAQALTSVNTSEEEFSPVKSGDTVQVHYTGKLEDGSEFDSTRDLSPLEFKIGNGGVIPGFENAIQGMCLGEKRTVLVPCEQAYGPRRKELVLIIDRKSVPSEIKVESGLQLQAKGPFGHPVYMTVTCITDKTITLDGNHQLAGQNLIFDIEVLNIH